MLVFPRKMMLVFPRKVGPVFPRKVSLVFPRKLLLVFLRTSTPQSLRVNQLKEDLDLTIPTMPNLDFISLRR